MFDVNPVQGSLPLPGPAQEPRFGGPADPGRLRLALQHKRTWIAGAIVLGAVIALPAARRLQPLAWVARTSLVWERPPGLEGPDLETPRELRTMVDSIELPTSLARVRRRLGLESSIEELESRISVEVSGELESNLVTILARWDDPYEAALVASAVVEVFMEHERQVEEGRRRELVQALDADLAGAHSALAKARSAYDAFRREHGITDISLQTEQAIDLAARMRAEADLAQAAAVAEETRSRTLHSESQRMGSTTVTRIVSGQRGGAVDPSLAQAEAELLAARTLFTEEHPSVQTLVARVAALRARAATRAPTSPAVESSEVRAPNAAFDAIQQEMVGATAQRQVELELQRTYRDLARAAQEHLQKLTAVQGRASGLLAAEQVALTHVSELEALRARAVDAARSTSTGLRVVSRALPPDAPETRVRQTLLAMAIPSLFALLAVFLVFAIELRGLVAYTASEFAFWGKAPVIGSTTWPLVPEAMLDLLDDIEDVAARASGKTLVVGATAADVSLARDVAFGLRELMEPPGAPVTVEAVAMAPGERAGAVGPGRYSVTLEAEGESPSEAHGSITHQSSDCVGDIRVSTIAVEAARRGADIEAWDGPPSGPALRRAARLADRVLVVAESGSVSFGDLRSLRSRIGRLNGIAFLVVGLGLEHAVLRDRIGPVEEFWHTFRAP